MANKLKISKTSGWDYILFIVVVGLVTFGVAMVFSSSYYNALSTKGDAFYYLKYDALWALVGFVAMIFASGFNYQGYKILAPIGLVFAIVLLCLVFTPLGLEINYAKRWIDLGIVTLMPGEFAKIFVILFVSSYLSKDSQRIYSFKDGILPCVLIIILFFTLIILQPNLSTAMTITGIIVSIMFVAGLRLRYLFFGFFAVLFAGGALIISEPYRLKRVTSFIDPFADPLDTGWQVVQSLLALGSGGLLGVGVGNSIQKTLYLPEPQNDFIFAIIGEEIGFIGCLLLICAFLVLIWRGIHISINAPDLFGCLVASGITAMIAIQLIINIAVTTSSMPPTGIALPFISWGGNSLLVFMFSVGILLNISKHIHRLET